MSDALDSVVTAFTAAIAGDVALLAAVHDREPSRQWLEAARACPIAEQFGLVLRSETAQAALAAFDAAMAQFPAEIGADVIDGLAAEYANIYLRYLYRASPTESVWLDEDGLERQQPMFAVKSWYRHHKLASRDWAKRSDDHLVMELHFLAHLFEHAKTHDDLAEAARFLDFHLLRWVSQFTARVAAETPVPYFAACTLLTSAYLDELRDMLADIGLPRVVPEDVPQKPAARVLTCGDERPFAPGTGPGW